MNFFDTYRMKPKTMYVMFRLWGVPKDTASRSINILWDDADEIIYTHQEEDEDKFLERLDRWRIREKSFLRIG